uniref:Uncharacterized protein n=1 Tax=Anopheles quadriannulatus TaxID=34691 RepID=A0A182XR18_ANOQN
MQKRKKKGRESVKMKSIKPAKKPAQIATGGGEVKQPPRCSTHKPITLKTIAWRKRKAKRKSPMSIER